MGFLRRSLTGVLLAALTLAGLVWAGHTVQTQIAARTSAESEPRPDREIVHAVRSVTVTPGTETPVLETFGEIRSRRTLEIRADASGRIAHLHPAFREGGRVAAGDTLVRLDPAEAEAELATARADLADARAALTDAESRVDLAEEDLAVAREQADLRADALDRQRDLADRGVGSTSAVEDAALAAAQARQEVVARRQALADAKSARAQAETQLERARIAVREAERALADTRITAPFDGRLAEVGVVEGGRVGAGEALARLVDPGALDAAFRLSAAQYARLRGAATDLPEADVTVILEAGATRLTAQGRITRESPVVGEGRTGRELYAALSQAEAFKPGDIVTVRVAEPPLSGVARLPAGAVGADGDVLVIGPDDRLRAKRVEIVRRQADTVLVRAPALDGAEVVADRRPALGEGIRVGRIAPGGDAAARLEDGARPAAEGG